MTLAPIVLFVYNRPWHTKQTIEALQKNTLASESDLIIYSDGYKDSLESKEGVLSVREYLKVINGFNSVKIIERDKNYGLAESIITGVGEVVNQYGKIIVLEDDMISSKYFIQYMNDALGIYENEEQVISISAYIYPIKDKLPETFFLKGADCWGWATWKRGWDLFEKDGKKLLRDLKEKKLTKEFDFSNSYPYTKMLQDQIAGKNNSWAIRWYASAFLKNKLTLYPGKSLISNIGLDGSGTHCGYNFSLNSSVIDTKVEVNKIDIKEDLGSKLVIINDLRNKNNFLLKGLRYFKKYVFKD